MIDGDHTSDRFQIAEVRPNPEQDCLAQEFQVILSQALNRLRPIYKEVSNLRLIQDEKIFGFELGAFCVENVREVSYAAIETDSG